MTDNLTAGERLIGEHHGGAAGPCIIVVAAIHGNEPTGIDAACRVLRSLERDSVSLCGDFYAFRGNMPALAQGVRYIRKDLNRIWKAPCIESALAAEKKGLDEFEDHELLALKRAIEGAAEKARGPVLVMDLHTSSAASVPFVVMGTGELLKNVNEQLHVPVIVDKLSLFQGMMLSYFDSQGHSTLAFEAGRHGTAESIDAHEAAIWLTLEGTGAMGGERLPQINGWRKALFSVLEDIPQELELVFRHAITREDRFEMLPGFKNYDAVSRGQALAKDRKGTITSPSNGRIFLPHYQSIGEDGFFLVR